MAVKEKKNISNQIETKAEKPLGQVVSFVSAKGGTGKTILSASTAYLLGQAGMSVVVIDTDFSTRGISLFLLGTILESKDLHIRDENCLADSILNDLCVQEVSPISIKREEGTYDVVLSNKEVWRGGVPDERFLGGKLTESNSTDNVSKYYEYLRDLCKRFRQEYDYVILDTRGGFDFTSAVPAAIADGYVVVIEADKVSLEQVKGFKEKIDEFTASINEEEKDNKKGKIRAALKGFIVNKAIFSVDDKLFPEELARLYDSKTFGVIPADPDTIRAYQLKKIPHARFYDSDFSNYSLLAIDNLISPDINWKKEDSKKKFEELSYRIQSAWGAKQRVERIQALIPIVLIGLLIVAAVFYLLFKQGGIAYSLETFYVTTTIFVLASIIGSIISSLIVLRKIDIPKTKIQRQAVGSVLILLWLGFAYLAILDIPKTFSRDALIQRVRDADTTIQSQGSENQKLEADLLNKDQLISNLNSNISAKDEQIKSLTSERDSAQSNYSQAQQQIIKFQNEISNLNSKVSSITAENDSLSTTLKQQEARVNEVQQRADNLQQENFALQRKLNSIDPTSPRTSEEAIARYNQALNAFDKFNLFFKKSGECKGNRQCEISLKNFQNELASLQVVLSR